MEAKTKQYVLNENHEYVRAARSWILNNPEAYATILGYATEQMRKGLTNISIRDIVGRVRWETRTKIANAITPALARIIEDDHPEIKFKKGTSTCEYLVEIKGVA